MIKNFENFGIAVDTVEDILLSAPSEAEIADRISAAIDRVNPFCERKDVLSHMATLFLNALLNRQELGSEAMNSAEVARRIISEM